MNKTQRLLREVWLRAWQTGRVELKLETPEKAVQMRFALYNATKKARAGADTLEMVTARQQCLVRWDGDCTLAVVKEDEEEGLAVLAEALGLNLANVQATADIAAIPSPTARRVGAPTPMPSGDELEDSARRMAQRFAEMGVEPAPVAKPTTPVFSTWLYGAATPDEGDAS